MPGPSPNDHQLIARLDIRGLVAGHDYGSRVVASNVVTYTWKRGGSSGTTMLTLTLTYTDASLATLSTWQWS